MQVQAKKALFKKKVISKKASSKKASSKAWKICRAPPLDTDEHQRLAHAYAQLGREDNDTTYYTFAHRVCKVYKRFIEDKSSLADDLHTNRDTMCESAISDVFCQVKNVDDLPHKGDDVEAKAVLLKVLEHVFQMPDAGSRVGDAAWIKTQGSKPAGISFASACSYNPLMRKLVKYLIKLGGDHGFPKVGDDEGPPVDQAYQQPRTGRRRVKGSLKPHKHLPYLCVSSVNAAVTELKNLGLYPVRVLAANMPSGKDWNNFAEVLYTFWILYCHNEGLVRTSDMARQVMIYIFYAHFKGPTGKQWPVIRAIHRMVTNGRHRFAATTLSHFDEFFNLLDREPRLVAKLNDKGEGGVPPEYTAAVENGLRSHGEDIHAMGTNAMRSQSDWKKVPRWMKREAYIAAVRHKWGRGSYWQWDHFSFEDYVERQTLALTFNKRHLPLSTGREFWPTALLRNPLRWSHREPCVVSKKRGKKGSRSPRMLTTPSKAACATEVSTPDVMIFDPELGKMVVVVCSDDEDC